MLNWIKKQSIAAWIILGAAVLALIALIIYSVNSTTGVMQNVKLDVEPIIYSVLAIVLLAGIITYITVMVRSALKNRVEEEIEPISLSKAALFIALGLAAVVFGGDVVVDSATAIAKSLGLSETLIGLTIVAIGTSLPELVTSVVASRKGESGLALGNAIGSNIFNILFILGMSSTLMPIPVVSENISDALVLIGICVLIYAFARFGEKIGRIKGLIMIAIYIAYTAYIIMR